MNRRAFFKKGFFATVAGIWVAKEEKPEISEENTILDVHGDLIVRGRIIQKPRINGLILEDSNECTITGADWPINWEPEEVCAVDLYGKTIIHRTENSS